MNDLDLELEHIFLEVRAERWHQIERFLFNYYCYRCGYVTKQDKPDWENARKHAPRSQGFESVASSVLEPIVPLAVVIGELKRYWRDGDLTLPRIRRLLDSLLDYVVISKSELQALKKAGLQNAMPASWYQSEERDRLDRFSTVGISVTVPN